MSAQAAAATLEQFSVPADSNTTIIDSANTGLAQDMAEVWRSRELLYFFIWRDIKVRYKQTLLGAAWAVIQPFFAMVIFSLFFGRLAKIPSGGVPYPIFAYTGLVAWTFFANALTNCSNTLVEHRNVVTKVFFPRLILPLSAVLSGLVDFAIAFAVLLLMAVFYGIQPSIAMLWLPLYVVFIVLTALGAGLLLGAANVEYRDVRYVLPFLLQVWLFATPIAYGSSLVPEKYRFLLGLNPMAGVVEGFRWTVLGEGQPDTLLAVSAAVTVLLLAGGFLFFRRVERSFADVI